MLTSEDVTEQEEQYLRDTIAFLNNRLACERVEISQKIEDIIAFRRDIYENTPADAQDMGKMSATAQMMSPLMVQTMDYHATEHRIDLFERMQSAPYFARIDFTTPRWGSEVVYIGIGNLEDEETFDVYVYDWRAPISSVFYRYELGAASYQAPSGIIEGEVTLKRQYEIANGKLNYFFDSGVNIVDEILKQTLSQNSSPQMRTIVETIQREQDIIIRDMENDLVIVQGVAGSGKTSIALHRAAYLMYEGLGSKLSAKNMLLLSPNRLFEQYISQVLPELGEENIRTVTFEEIFQELLHHGDDVWEIGSRNAALEDILTEKSQKKHKILYHQYVYKTTDEFLSILDWYIDFYLEHIVTFPDFVFGDQLIAEPSQMKERVLNAKKEGLRLQASLKQVEIHSMEVVRRSHKDRLKELEKSISQQEEHYFDYKETAREVLAGEIRFLSEQIKKCVVIDYLAVYQTLMTHEGAISEIEKQHPSFRACAKATATMLEKEHLDYVDAMAILYLKVKMDTVKPYQEIRQVVIDEAQDYSAVHFEILQSLFPTAKYTVLADINQTLLDTETSTLYETIQKTLGKKKSILISLNKSFRCSYEISIFSSHFAEPNVTIETLERHDAPPAVVGHDDEIHLLDSLMKTVGDWKAEGFGTIAIVCKTMADSRVLYEKLQDKLGVTLLEENSRVNLSNIIILPVYLAKGLEFDCVAVYGVDEAAFFNEDHRRLLYISVTRALHRLCVFYQGKASPLLPKEYLAK